jgi:hypothetical protein
MASSPEVSSISYSLDGNRNETLSFSKVSTGGYLGTGTLNNLPDGYHHLDAYFHAAHFRIEKSASTTFLVNTTGSQPSPLLTTNPSPVPTQVPEFSWLAILPLFVALLFIAIKLKRRKTAKINVFIKHVLKSFKQGQNSIDKHVRWENISYKTKKNGGNHWIDSIISHRNLGSIQRS